MQSKEIIKKVERHIELSLAGQESEDSKFDFKLKWYDLKSEPGINEFLKDSTSIANTFGLEGFIVIGFDEKSKIFQNARFSDSGLRDTSDINNMLVRRVSPVFDFNYFDITVKENNLSVFQIPPSLDKPHVIKEYKKIDKKGIEKIEQNRIFVRKNTSVFPASRYDIDVMYYDRKNILPEYSVDVNLTRAHKMHIAHGTFPNGQIHFSIENLGRRALCIKSIQLISQKNNGVSCETSFLTTSVWIKNISENISTKIVLPNTIEFFKSDIVVDKPSANWQDYLDHWDKDWIAWTIIITLTNGKILTQKIQRIEDPSVQL